MSLHLEEVAFKVVGLRPLLVLSGHLLPLERRLVVNAPAPANRVVRLALGTARPLDRAFPLERSVVQLHVRALLPLSAVVPFLLRVVRVHHYVVRHAPTVDGR